MRRSVPWRFCIFVVSISCVLLSCSEDLRRVSTEERPASGEQLARTHCGSCHLYPEPSLLDTESWREVLPHMGHHLGIYSDADRDSLSLRYEMLGADADTYFPEQPQITPSDWDAIEAFYLSTAPEVMAPPRRQHVVQTGLDHFEVRVPVRRFEMPLTLLTKIRPDDRLFFLGNYGHRVPSTLSMIDRAGQVLIEWNLPDAPIRVHWDAARLYVLLVGPGPEPTEASAGSIVVIEAPGAPPRTILAGLKRPVDMEVADLNGDGIDDFVICEYGHDTGFLSFYASNGNGNYERQILTTEPGAVQAVIHDFDKNGTLDIGVLMAQGDEGFDIYTNNGGGVFTRHRKLRFPPVFGSNDIQIADFNDDGNMDLLYVNGDNADFTRIVKPYHGLRIYLADDKGDFEETLFFPLPGAYSARVGDFDADGDLDIAAVSFFPDYLNAPELGFVYLENKGDLQFEAYTFADAQRGRWITMDAGDLDGDGDLDILLGLNIGFSPEGDTTNLFERWVKEAPSYVLLENTLR